MMDSKRYNVIDLFCGCGGFSLGFENAGFHMSPNEWADVLRNPVALYKTDQINALPRNGMEVSFEASKFKPVKLLSWQG